MYTSHTGKRYLEIYNKDHGTDYSPKEFFDEVMFPIFFDCPDEEHLMQVHGSPFFQPSYVKAAQKEGVSISQYRKDKFLEGVDAINQGEPPHAGFGVGYMSSGPDQGTSGQVTSMELAPDEDELICSWIGGALGVGMAGGVNFLFEDDDLLRFVGQGWQYYRRYIENTTGMKGRQLETWNGLWLCYAYQYRDDLEKAYEAIQNLLRSDIPLGTNAKGQLQLERPKSWARQVLAFAAQLQQESELAVYAYNFGQMNTTYGFLKLKLPEIKKLQSGWKRLLGLHPETPFQHLKDVFQQQYSLQRAAQMGGIGLRALEPKDMRQFLSPRGDKDPWKKFAKLDKDEKVYQFLQYQNWIIAMLNNEETLDLADQLARALITYEQGATRGKTTRSNTLKSLWESHSRQGFIEQLTGILEEEAEAAPTFKQVVDQVYLHIPADSFKLFRTLARFQYTYLQTQS